MYTRIIAAALALASLAASPVRAQDAAPAAAREAAQDSAIQTVETRAVRDPAMMPYADAYDMLTRVHKLGEGRIDFLIRVLSAKSPQPLPDLEVALQGTTIFEKLALTDDGYLTVPLDAKYVADKADFVTNKKKGSIAAQMWLVPVLPHEGMTYADMAASLAAGKRALGELMPWYMRILFGRLHDVQLCYPDATQQVALGSGPSRAATQEWKNPLNGKMVYCAVFSTRETEAAPQTTITAPPGYVALFR